ncbi:FMN-binding protein [Thiocystis violascens]|uniref:Putative NADH:ubiquinone oxidoreductase, subunit RnfG n=1 Tax=Thiocystis violascens (strain ATCC 17096 / DSM 198 / 6111) TaxID=765911 RepID=I3YDJ2_THIV6|nr:FMN-binding protein [Thiocystis violascens]AFL75060.1 putative NADH:ubiquinone oxidoreductase, subunit RnfG [Thiocystis violascens DSM 198]
MNSNVQIQPAVTPAWPMLRTLGGIAMFSGLLVALVYQFTLPIIAENQRVLTERAVFQVLPGAVSKRDFVIADTGELRLAGEGVSGAPVYAGYDDFAQLKGLAITGSAPGYAGPVTVMYAYDPSCQCIVRSKVLNSTETPGFGDKLDTDPVFLKNFEALDARLNAEGSALANEIVTVKHGTKSEPWQIDAITGATISSKAMGRAANAAAQRAVPAIQRAIQQDPARLSQPH